MTSWPGRRSDLANAAAILLACAAGHAFPYATLPVAYAVLGPAHYLTEIAWLEERSFFVARPLRSPRLVTCAALAAAVAILVMPGAGWKAAVIAAAMAIGLAATYAGGDRRRAALTVVSLVGGGLALAAAKSDATATLLAVLVPTVVHVFAFTLAFMVAGAMRSPRPLAWLNVGLLVAMPLTFLVPDARALPAGSATEFFGGVADLLAGAARLSPAQVWGMLGAAYAAHYLNWAAKVEVVGWHRAAGRRLPILAGLYALTLYAYWLDYRLGFAAMASLSLGHVLLEFPLNARTFDGIGRGLLGALGRRARAA